MSSVEDTDTSQLEWVTLAENGRYACIKLEHLFNGIATSSDSKRDSGLFSYISRCTFPAEELPEANEITMLSNIPFLFPDKRDGCYNNIESEEQTILLPNPSANSIALLGACDTTKFQEVIEVKSLGKTGVYPFGFSSWLDEQPDYNNILAWRGTHIHTTTQDLIKLKPVLWIALVHLPKRKAIQILRLPYNPSLHIFAITLIDNNQH